MTQRFEYDARRDPPAPVLVLRLGAPGADLNYALVALVDTGSDSTVVPQDAADRLRLPLVGEITITGAGGFRQRAAIHAAIIEAAESRGPVEVIALGREGLVGRDLLNQWTVTLRGPQRVMEIS